MPSAKVVATSGLNVKTTQILTTDNPPRPQPSIPPVISAYNLPYDITKLRVLSLEDGADQDLPA
jgi:hypothetical protein